MVALTQLLHIIELANELEELCIANEVRCALEVIGPGPRRLGSMT